MFYYYRFWYCHWLDLFIALFFNNIYINLYSDYSSTPGRKKISCSSTSICPSVQVHTLSIAIKQKQQNKFVFIWASVLVCKGKHLGKSFNKRSTAPKLCNIFFNNASDKNEGYFSQVIALLGFFSRYRRRTRLMTMAGKATGGGKKLHAQH